MKIVYQCLITKYYPPAFRSLNSIPNPSHILLFWNRWLEIRITKWESRTIFGSKMRTALHACWLALDTHVFTARFICGPKCPALSSNIFFGTMSKRKISSYFGIERGKTIDQDEKKKKRIHTWGTIARRKWCSTSEFETSQFPHEMIEWSQVVTVWKEKRRVKTWTICLY